MQIMSETKSRREFLTRIEFWVVNTLFVFGIIFLLINRLGDDPANAPYRKGFDQIGLPFYYYKNFLIPVIIELVIQFAGFLVMNFVLVPRLIKKEQVLINTCWIVLVFIGFGLADWMTDHYPHAYRYVSGSGLDRVSLFMDNLRSPLQPFVLFGIFTLLKYSALYFITNAQTIEQKNRFVQRDAINAFVVWLISMFILIISESGYELVLGWGVIAPMGILLYCFSFYSLIPRSITKRNGSLRYLLKVALLLDLFLFPVFMFSVLASSNEEVASVITVFNFFFQLLVTAPVSWLLYKKSVRGREEIQVLQKKLGKSNANLDFLRSQINPHFLFNALNTLYGTAIQENAERTSEGIQKLGDMMRFMLQENMQDKISLTRETEYLKNYISLQRLRTDAHPHIHIEANIQEGGTNLQIAPMLLIPFVENAFKHGISFREPSNISVLLEVKEGQLRFEVSNLKHERPENDPERNNSGIGLENVRQRLNLLYANNHQLVIRDTRKEFTVHLTIQLAKFGK